MAMVRVVIVFVDRFIVEGTLAMRVIAATSDVRPGRKLRDWLALAGSGLS